MQHLRNLGLTDLYFLLRYILKAFYADSDWVFQRCREVQENPNGYLDLWAREHFKSTIITYALTIQDVLNDPEVTVGIFSHTRPIAKGFLRQIKREFESNEFLKSLYPEILWADPKNQAPKWSEDDGIVVKRQSNPREATIEASGLVDGQPTSKHYKLAVYDDTVTRESVTTPEMIKKVTEAWELSLNLHSEGGRSRYIGTRYHYNDSYATMMARGSVKPRIYAATKDGTVDGEPVYLSRDRLAIKRRDMGPYTFGCFVGETRVLMSDWTERRIDQIEIGDEIVGYTFGIAGQRSTLAKSKVMAKQTRTMPVVRFTFASGREIVGTEDHKFWSGRADRGYAPLSLNDYHGLKAACSIYEPEAIYAPFPIRDSGYLAGMFDGEGSASNGIISISQSMAVNPGVCERIEAALKQCGIEYAINTPTKRPNHRNFYVKGGRQGAMRFLHVISGAAKSKRLADQMFDRGSRNIGKGTRDTLVSIEPVGEAEVFNIQTETGNYVASGYAVKNCQMLQDPTADHTQGFKKEWLLYYRAPVTHTAMTKVILVDPANEKKQDSDYTSAFVLGFNADRHVYVLDMVRDRLNLTERTKMLFDLHRKYQPDQVGYERYGMQSDIAHIKSEMERLVYYFEITELGGPMPKNDRIRRLIPIFEQGAILFPDSFHKVNYEKRTDDLTNVFINEEYLAFPVAAHDDMLDALARMEDEAITVDFPLSWDNDDDRYDDTERGRSKHAGY